MHSQPQGTLGVDLGGTSVRIGLFDDAMQLVAATSMPTRVAAGPQSVVHEIAEAIERLTLQQNTQIPRDTILGIGIGSPGPINLRTGVLGLLPNLPGWDHFPLRDALAAATGLPVELESDANAAALAEWKMGVGRSTPVDSMAMITLGTGVGSGLILGGRIWHGMFGMGGEVGHATVAADGPLCGCGSRGCLEVYASANGLLRLAGEAVAAGEGSPASPALQALVARSPGCTPLEIALLAEQDSSAHRVFERMGRYLGIGLASLINTLDLPLIVIGGGVASSWHLFAPAMFRTLRDYSVVYRLAQPTQAETHEPDRTFICPAALGPSAGLSGAALLPRMMAENAYTSTVPTLAEETR